MAVAGVLGIAKASIRNTGTSPIAIIFICISLIFIVDFLLLLCPVKNNSLFVAGPHVRFESGVVIRFSAAFFLLNFLFSQLSVQRLIRFYCHVHRYYYFSPSERFRFQANSSARQILS
jgi:hypothetical protein